MKMRTRLLLFTIGFLLGTGIAHAEPLVTLKPTTEIAGTTVRLSDIFEGIPHDVDRVIATAPAPGKTVTYDMRVLVRLAEHYRLDWQPQGANDHTLVKRASTHISQDSIRAAVLAKLAEPGTSATIRGKAEIVFDNRAPELDLPIDKSPNFKLVNFNYDAQDRKFHTDLVTEGGADALSLSLSGRVMVKRDIATFAHKTESGTVLALSDLEWISIPEEKVTPDMITDGAQVVGRELRRDSSEGATVRARDLSAPRLVVRGALVTLKVETPYLLITAQGRALQDGAAGDVVRVTNTQSNRVVEGTVVSSGVVRVATTAQALSPKAAM